MTKHKQSNKSKLFLLTIIIFSFFVIFVAAKNFRSNYINIPQINPTKDNNLYNSSSQKFSVSIPSKFTIEDTYNLMILKNNIGTITVSSVGTNFESLDEYLIDLSIKNNFSLDNQERLTINSLPAIKLKIGSRLDYFIYGTEWTVYTLSTDSEALYDDLDQIVRSFKYTPTP